MTRAPAPPPASLIRRYAAWSLDAAAIGLLVVVCLHRWLRDALGTAGRALDGLTRTMAGTMQAALDTGATPLELARTWMVDPALHGAVSALAAATSALVLIPMLVFALVSLIWFTAFEGGLWQATPGKRLLGLRVIDDDGRAPHFARAALRQGAGLLSWLSLNLGHALAGLAPRHQALHDRIAGTRVVQADDRPLQMGVRLWLALQLPAVFLLLALLLRAVDQSLASALDAALAG